MKLTTICCSTLLAAALSSQAAVVWTGATDNDFFNDANWDFSGAVNGTTAIDPTTTINEDLTITGATVTGATASFGYFSIGDGFGLTLDNTSLTISGSGGARGVDDGAGSGRTNAPSSINLTNGSSLSLQYVSVGVDINVDGTSDVRIRGGGDGINSQTELSRIILDEGGQLRLTTRAEFDEQVTASSGAGNIVVNGVNATVANMDDLFTFSGGTGTATPEPSSTALLGLGGLALILRRRK